MRTQSDSFPRSGGTPFDAYIEQLISHIVNEKNRFLYEDKLNEK